MAETGYTQYESEASFTREERDEAEGLAAVVVKQFRKACGQVERVPRRRPVRCSRRRHLTWDGTRRVTGFWMPPSMLCRAPTGTHDGLERMKDVRRELKSLTTSYLGPFGTGAGRLLRLAQGFDHPVVAGNHPAGRAGRGRIEREAEDNRAIGRRLLAALDAPDAFERDSSDGPSSRRISATALIRRYAPMAPRSRNDAATHSTAPHQRLAQTRRRRRGRTPHPMGQPVSRD